MRAFFCCIKARIAAVGAIGLERQPGGGRPIVGSVSKQVRRFNGSPKRQGRAGGQSGAALVLRCFNINQAPSYQTTSAGKIGFYTEMAQPVLKHSLTRFRSGVMILSRDQT